jgi:hypothetical protein
MLGICRRKAEAAGVRIPLHRAGMEAFSLERRYRTIYVPFGSFMLLEDVGKAYRALRCFRAHLADGGRAFIPLHLPWLHDVGVEPAVPGEWRLRRVAARPEDDAVVRCYEKASFDFERQIQHVRLRFEVARGGAVIATERSEQRMRWYTREEFAGLLGGAGFRQVAILEGYTWNPAGADSATFMFVAS